MKRKIIGGLKIYFCCVLYILTMSFIYSFYLMKSGNDSSKIFELILGITTFLLLGILYGNMIHKRGLLVGLGIGIFHILLVHFIFFLSTGDFHLKWFPLLIYTLSCALGGVLGMTFKKIF